VIVINDTGLPDDSLRAMLRHGARGFRDAGVLVHVLCERDRSGRYLGRAHDAVSSRRYADRLSLKAGAPFEHVIEVVYPDQKHLARLCRHGVKLRHKHSIARFGPVVPVETVYDYLVYIAAHEFRHIWQFRRRRADRDAGRRGRHCTEVDAEKWGVRALSKYRVACGRSPIPETKGKPPFGPPGREGLLVVDDWTGVPMYAKGVGQWTRDRKCARVLRADPSSQRVLSIGSRALPFKATGVRYEVLRWGR
jgi:hypothetical protein